MSVFLLPTSEIDWNEQEIGNFVDAVSAAMRTVCTAQKISPDNTTFHNARYFLYKVAASPYPSQVLEAVLSDPRVEALKSRMFEVCARAGEVEEQMIAAGFLSEDSTSLVELCSRYYGDVYQKFLDAELSFLSERGVPLVEGEKIGFIGSGAMPIPAYLLASQQPVSVCCIERHATCCQLSHQLAKRVGIVNKVTVVQADARDADYTGMTKVFFSNWISGRPEIIARIASFPDVEILILRDATPDSLSSLINSEVETEALSAQNFSCLGFTDNGPGYSLRSVIYTRDK